MANTDHTELKVSTPASNNEVGRGYTRQVTIGFQDLVDNNATTSDGDTQTYELFDLPLGSILKGVHYYLRTAFDDSGGGSNITLQIGDTGDADGIMTAKQIHLDGTEIPAGGGDGVYFTVGGDAGTKNDRCYGDGTVTANTVEALFTPTGFYLGELTAGEVVFVAEIIYLNQAQS